jgi:prepilin-type N-terminal cleavage/methylation domain-containing protein
MKLFRGFTLAEIAVAVAVIALLIGGLLIPLSTQYELLRARETERTLETIRDALLGFAVANGRLPCPADPTLGAGANLGQEWIVTAAPPVAPTFVHPGGIAPTQWCATNLPAVDAVRGVSAGALPWATLGVPETDAWGRRFSYMVTTVFADNAGCPSSLSSQAIPPGTVGGGASFCISDVSNLFVLKRQAAGPLANLPRTAVVAVVISHGRNGFNARLPGGGLVGAAPGADENTNAIAAAGTQYIARDTIRADIPCNDIAGPQLCEFDDLVIGIDAGRLVGRMVNAGRLP